MEYFPNFRLSAKDKYFGPSLKCFPKAVKKANKDETIFAKIKR